MLKVAKKKEKDDLQTARENKKQLKAIKFSSFFFFKYYIQRSQ
jgi:hypothetical protein